nr:MAG TPA: hypothetical protein [Caudoviricetes sp.]
MRPFAPFPSAVCACDAFVMMCAIVGLPVAVSCCQAAVGAFHSMPSTSHRLASAAASSFGYNMHIVRYPRALARSTLPALTKCFQRTRRSGWPSKASSSNAYRSSSACRSELFASCFEDVTLWSTARITSSGSCSSRSVNLMNGPDACRRVFRVSHGVDQIGYFVPGTVRSVVQSWIMTYSPEPHLRRETSRALKPARRDASRPACVNSGYSVPPIR